MASIAPSVVRTKSGLECTIRSATPADADALLDCARDVFATSTYTLTQADEFTMTAEDERKFITEKHEAEHELFLLAIEGMGQGPMNGRVVGMLDLKHPTKRRKHRHTVLLGISVRSTHRGQGVGEALMRAAIDWAERDPTLELMTLEVYAANAVGLNLYRKLGFKEFGRLPAGCKHDDGTTWEQVMMVRPLG
jgi:ribosomal protein S18 acetylase RimI-like enzyme